MRGMPAAAQPSGRAIDFGVLLALAYATYVRELHEHLATQGFADLGRSDGYVFKALDAEPLTTSGLAERFGITKQGAAQIVADMRRRGYLDSAPDPSDARARLLRLTPRAVAAMRAAHDFHQRYERRLTRDHGADEVAALRALLTVIAGAGGPLDPHLRGLYV
jgi:DNA-binding MarR family transcriptional regulator